MKGNKGCRRVLKRLYRKNKGYCCYCGIKTRLPISGDQKSGNRDDSASIEHVYSKLDIRRYAQKNDYEYVKLSCRKCNISRGTYESALLTTSNFLNGICLNILLPFEYWPFPMEEYIYP